jgi:MFS transporter, DHA1 family, multidrug resistance protein
MSENTRKRGLLVLLVNTFLMWGGFFMVIPLIAIYYVDGLGWAAGAVGLVLGVRQFLQQGLTLIGGALADRLGARGLIALGMLIRAASFVLMGFATSYPLLMISAMLAALGGALFDSPSSAAGAALTTETERSRFYSTLGMVGGLGMTLGPLAGAALLKQDFAIVAFVAAACFFLAFLVTIVFLPPVKVSSGDRSLTSGITMALADRPFMTYTFLLMGFWFMWVQMTISVPLATRVITGTNDAVSWVYALNSLMGIVLQYPLLWLVERWLKPLPILILGMIIMSLGMGSIAFANSTVSLLVCVAIFATGRILAGPVQQTIAASLANPAALGSYFGVSALALALGGGIGNAIGGVLYGLGISLDLHVLPWMIFAGAGLLSALGLALVVKDKQQPASNPATSP